MLIGGITGKKSNRKGQFQEEQNVWLSRKGTAWHAIYKFKIPKVQQCKYLGSVLIKGGKYNPKIQQCIEILKDAFQKLSKLLRNRKIL